MFTKPNFPHTHLLLFFFQISKLPEWPTVMNDLILQSCHFICFGSSQSNTSEYRGSSFRSLLHRFIVLPKALKSSRWEICCGFGKCWYFIISLFVVYWFIMFLQVLWGTLSAWWQIERALPKAFTLPPQVGAFNIHRSTHTRKQTSIIF